MTAHPLRQFCRSLGRLARRLRADSRGNILMIMGFATVPLVFATGLGIDYSRAEKLQTRMNAAADAAALAAVTQPMMQQTGATAQAAAQAMFINQTTGLSGMVFNSATDLTVTVNTSGSLNNGRTVVVTYKAKSNNYFSSILGAATLAITGTATASAQGAPNINFYLMLDDSPSMLLPSSSTGLSAILSATTNSHNSVGCDFACHEQNPHNDAIYVENSLGYDIFLNANYYAASSSTSGYQTWYAINASTGYLYNSSGTLIAKSCSSTSLAIACTKNANGNNSVTSITGYFADGYWLTRNYDTLYNSTTAIPLRIDDEKTAAQDLIPFAQNMATSNAVTYKMQIYDFNWTHTGYTTPVNALTGSMANVSTMSASSVPDLYSTQDYWYGNNCPTSGLCNSDQGTEFYNMFTAMNAAMATPGDGSTAATPQGVLFLVTDGMTDENTGSGRVNRELSATDLGACTAIKNRGIKIAILYTQYLAGALAGDSWSQSNVAPYLPNVAPALQSCASAGSDGTPLFYQVTTDQSISNALSALFALTVQNAHLTS